MSDTTAFTHTVSTDGPAKGMTFSMRRRPDSPVAAGAPLVVALPGGTYSSVYFDVPGQSLLDTAETVGVPVIAVDRPGYLGSTKAETDGSIILRNAEVLDHLIGELWDTYGAGAPGVVVIGHSIGGAVTTAIAARQPGLAAARHRRVRLPGAGAGRERVAWAALPDLEFVELPGPVKDFVMYGPDWTHTASDAGRRPRRRRARAEGRAARHHRRLGRAHALGRGPGAGAGAQPAGRVRQAVDHRRRPGRGVQVGVRERAVGRRAAGTERRALHRLPPGAPRRSSSSSWPSRSKPSCRPSAPPMPRSVRRPCRADPRE